MTRKGFKQGGALLAAIWLACGAVSCGGKTPNVQIVEKEETEPEYLSFFSQKSYIDSDIGKFWSDRFVEKYNQKVYINYDGAAYYGAEGASYRELLEKRLESSSPDDLYLINAEDVLEFEQKGYWMDLSGMEFADNLSEAALYQSTYNGKVFSIPLKFTGFGFYWNVTMLEEQGLTVPENLEEFMSTCEALKEAGILPYGANKGYALTVPAMCAGLNQLYGTPDQDQRIADLNSGETAFSTYMEAGFSFIARLIEEGYLDPVQAMETEPRKDDIQMFMDGKCAFICTELGETMDESKKYSFQRQFTGLPLLEGGSIAVYGADARLCVNPNSKHLETALEFIEMVGTTEALDESAKQGKAMSAAKDSKVTMPPLQQKMYELLRQPGQIPNQDFMLHFNTWENIRNVCREICGGISVDRACEMIDELQMEELKRYNGEADSL